jgi:hypothetical protein
MFQYSAHADILLVAARDAFMLLLHGYFFCIKLGYTQWLFEEELDCSRKFCHYRTFKIAKTQELLLLDC